MNLTELEAELAKRSISLCSHCHCMTKTIKGMCGKCGEKK